MKLGSGRTDAIDAVRYRIAEYSVGHSLDQTIQKALDEMEAATGSTIGFFHFVDTDLLSVQLQGWSTNTLATQCNAGGKYSHYAIDNAGVWLDCVREGRPIVHNDYASLSNRRGLPEGHATMVRELTVPVYLGGKPVVVVGVGNKPTEYDQCDLDALVQLAEQILHIVLVKRAQEELRESEQKFRTVADFTYDWEVWTDSDGAIRYISPSCKRITGHSAAEFEADPSLLERIVHPDDRSEVIKHLRGERNEAREEDVEFEFRIQTPDGQTRWIAQVGNPLYGDDGRYLGWRGSNREITDRVHATQRLEQSEGMCRQMIATALDLIWRCDADGRYIFLNPAWQYVLGYTEQEMLGRHFSEFLAPERVGLDLAKFDDLIAGEIARDHETVHIAKNGRRVILSFNAVAWHNEDGRVAGTSGTARDVTERRQAEPYARFRIDVLRMLGEADDVYDSLRSIPRLLKSATGVDAVGIRLRDGDDFPYFAQEGFSDDFLQAENSLLERTGDGGVCRNEDGSVRLEGTCGQVLSAAADFGGPYFTANGSFYTSDSFSIKQLPPGEDSRRCPRNRCIRDGYASIALVPIKCHDDIAGLIQVNSRQTAHFTPRTLKALETVAEKLGHVMERQEAQTALRTSRDLMGYIIEHDRTAIAVHDRDLNYLYVSKRYLEEYGVQEQDVIGKHHYQVFPDLPQKWRDVHQRALAGETISAVDDPYERADGTVDWTTWECRPWYESDGAIGGIIVYTEIVTERKLNETALQTAYEREAAIANELLHSAERERRRLAVELHDGLGQTLAAAKLRTQLLASEGDGDVTEAVEHLVGLLDQSICAVRSLTVDLSPPELSAGLLPALERVRDQIISNSDLSCDFAVDPALEELQGDIRMLVFRATRELLNNVRRHAAADWVRVNGRIEMGTVVLRVQDNGRGFAPSESYPEEFTRDHFGLYSLRREVRSLCGTIEIDSAPDEGTMVKIRVPLSQPGG